MMNCNTLTIGIDLGDKFSAVCVLDEQGEILEESRIRSTPKAFGRRFGMERTARVVLETGTHSRWVSTLLNHAGHEVLVADARRLRMIFANENKEITLYKKRRYIHHRIHLPISRMLYIVSSVQTENLKIKSRNECIFGRAISSIRQQAFAAETFPPGRDDVPVIDVIGNHPSQRRKYRFRNPWDRRFDAAVYVAGDHVRREQHLVAQT